MVITSNIVTSVLLNNVDTEHLNMMEISLGRYVIMR